MTTWSKKLRQEFKQWADGLRDATERRIKREELIVDMYINGTTIDTITKELKTSATHVYRVIELHGVAQRKGPYT